MVYHDCTIDRSEWTPAILSPRRDHEDLDGLLRAVLPESRRPSGKGDRVAGRQCVLLVGEGRRHLAPDHERELLARLGMGTLSALPPRTEDRDDGLQSVHLLHEPEGLDVSVGPGTVQAMPLLGPDDERLLARFGGGKELAQGDAQRLRDLVE